MEMSVQEETPIREPIKECSTGERKPKRPACQNDQNTSVMRKSIEWPVDNANSQSIWRILSHLM